MIRERLKRLFTRRPADSALDEEFEFHLDMEREKLEGAGVAPAEARRRARLAFGGYDRIAEETRDSRGFTWFENVLRDTRHAVRGLARNPGFSSVAILTLAIGIGATTAVFSLANSLLIRPVAGVRAPDELVVVQFSSRPGLITGISHVNITDLHAATPALESVAGYARRSMQARAGSGVAFEVEAAVVQGEFFRVLGLRPRQGRWFTAEESAPAAAGDLIVISDRFRVAQFGDATNVVGRTLHLNSAVYTIIGVTPEGFHGTEHTSMTDVWLPPGAYGRMYHRPVDAADRRASIFYELVGRLAPGATAVQAELQLRAGMNSLIDLFPDINANYVEFQPTVHAGVGLPVSLREGTARTMRLLLGVVSVLLLIACANVANLLLSRGLARQGEITMRRALGASGARLVQQHLTEGMVLSLLSGIIGIGVAASLGVIFRAQSLLGLPAIDGLTLDWRVITFALCGAMLTGVIFTLAPAVAALRAHIFGPLQSAGRSVGSQGVRLRAALTVVQIAASLALLVGALLLVRTVQNLRGIERGYDAEAVLAYGFDPSPQGYDSESARALRRRLLESVRGLPGIQSASVASFLPVPGDRPLYRLSVPGRDGDPIVVAGFEVSADYFRTLGTRIVAGRAFTGSEEHEPPTAGAGVILSETAARELFGTVNPVDRLIEIGGFTSTTLQPVIGVAEDVRMAARDHVMPAVYQPLGAAALSHGYVLVRSSLTAAQTERLVTDALVRIDPNIPLFRAESLANALRRAIAEERLLARVLGLFALLAVTLAAIGLYGVIAYSVVRRRSEIGIRMAIGAPASEVVRLIARQSFALLSIGVLLGTLGAYWLSRSLENRIYEVSPVDPATYLAAIGFFAVVTALASAIPARAATRIDPIETLRPQ
jgi:predicted permease